MSRSRASAKKAGARCMICETSMTITEDKRTHRRKYCSNECLAEHRRRAYALNPRPRAIKATLAERLWSRVAKLSSGCWEWQGYRMPSGHGQIGIGQHRVTTTHRVSWELSSGEAIPTGLMVRHRCDNPPCVNPEHLELGTAADNSRDAMERGRTARGFRLPNTRLSDEDVRVVRELYCRWTGPPGVRGYQSNSDELANRFGVTRKYIAAIVAGSERVHV